MDGEEEAEVEWQVTQKRDIEVNATRSSFILMSLLFLLLLAVGLRELLGLSIAGPIKVAFHWEDPLFIGYLMFLCFVFRGLLRAALVLLVVSWSTKLLVAHFWPLVLSTGVFTLAVRLTGLAETVLLIAWFITWFRQNVRHVQAD